MTIQINIELTDAAKSVKKFVDEGQEQPVVVAALIEARYKIIELVMPRGIILSQNPEITFIESDLPGMIQRKQQLVQQLIGQRPNLHFLAIDATSRPNPLPLHDSIRPISAAHIAIQVLTDFRYLEILRMRTDIDQSTSN